MNDPQFIFTCCQPGAESALKAEFSRNHPDLNFAFSRPGFVTFKNNGKRLPSGFDLKSVFARTYGESIGRSESLASAVEIAKESLGDRPIERLHVWPRTLKDEANPLEGFASQFQNELTLAAEELGVPEKKSLPNLKAKKGENVLDLIRVDDDVWWIGWHQANSAVTRDPGGICRLEPNDKMVSRAYLKMLESLNWSQLPVTAGDHCVEIGSAPGGSCQALLEKGLIVTGIDPSKMDESLLAHPRFTHIRKRGADVRRSEYGNFRWLMIDTNVAPNHTLDTLEHIVNNRRVHIQGMIITLKLTNWKMANNIPEYLERVRSWGYRYVRARQLAHNHQEFCVAALRNRSQTRFRMQRKNQSA